MKPTAALVIALAGLTSSVAALSEPKQEVLQFVQENREPGMVAPVLKPQRASSPPHGSFPASDDVDGLRVPTMKAEAGKGARDAKMVILGVAGAAGLFALGLL